MQFQVQVAHLGGYRQQGSEEDNQEYARWRLGEKRQPIDEEMLVAGIKIQMLVRKVIDETRFGKVTDA